MKQVKQFIVCAIIVNVSISCQFNEAVQANDNTSFSQASIAKDISPEEFQKLIGDDAIILDVRTKDEYSGGHLEGSVNIDFFSKTFIEEVLKLDRSKSLLIHCASGGRSSKAMSKLSGSGFKSMYNMLGGYGAWSKSNLPFVK